MKHAPDVYTAAGRSWVWFAICAFGSSLAVSIVILVMQALNGSSATLVQMGIVFFIALLLNAALSVAVQVLHRDRRDLVKRLTVQARLNAGLREKEERFNLAMKGANDGLWDWDIVTNHVYYSERWAEILGYTVDELEPTARTWTQMLRREDKSKVRGDMNIQFAQQKEIVEGEYDMQRKDGRWIRVLNRGVVVYHDGKPIRMVGTLLDISGRLMLFRQKEESEAQTQAKTAFLAHMSHEIRTPMNGIVGMVDLMTRTDLDKNQRQMLETIHNSSVSLLKIIEDILDFSLIEAGKMSVSVEKADLLNVVENVVETVAATAQQNGVRLILNVDCDLPRYFATDASRLRQVLLNLLGNAVKFCAQKKSAEPPLVELSAQLMPGGQVKFLVIDNGMGIPSDIQELLFQPFFQANETESRQISGTGLGLAISYDLIEIMGGQLDVQSVPGEGATFSVVLPLIAGVQTEQTCIEKIDGLEQYSLFSVVDDELCRDRFRQFAKYWGRPLTALDVKMPMWDWAKRQTQTPFFLVSLTGKDRTLGFVEQMHEIVPKAKFLGLTEDPSARLGRYNAHLYLVRRSPLLPSRMVEGVHALIEEHKEREDGKSVEQVSAKKGSILLVEDNRINLEVLTRQLALLGYSAQIAMNGQEGLEIWRDGAAKFDLILTDCQMPVMDGLEMVQKIRSIERAHNMVPIPIVGISANALKGEGERCIAAGMSEFLTKPAKLDELRDVLGQWAAGDRKLTGGGPNSGLF
ncbi:Sensor kinase protein RcsC [Thalassovita gelatinovora]|uniref:Sensory/regulatory protein RpfC n=1 Tax=Thalassovita gelatinovora TaxID=53501 RepID=A0A0P1F6Z1_THAGE|nr:PAS domain-containing hybrid sensor histidine kinase/response regulator [Thalassovita gelatinovora]QIZ79217.1 response regulator [Thalassovita gelatinovora]CUH63713.1 Sensor kinase protein RcsC [Thalassovita gelatinovora]SER02178.1 PAS domain S-box-containing protein [Thalassovita gelatinovora]